MWEAYQATHVASIATGSITGCIFGGGATSLALTGLAIANPVAAGVGIWAVGMCSTNMARQMATYHDQLKLASDQHECFNIKLVRRGPGRVDPGNYSDPPGFFTSLQITNYRVRSSPGVCLDGV
jgi:hypothetical protein